MRSRPSVLRSLAVFLFVGLLLARPAAAETVIRLATLAPDGSSWMKLFRVWQKAVETKTAGRVKVKIYAGGVQGDERDVLRKIKLGQLSGGAVTGIGLSAIDPEVRALDIARTDDELAGLRNALDEYLRKKFEDKGYILISWGDVGPVHLFTQKPIQTLADVQSLKLWLWNDDAFSKRAFSALGVRGVPMGVPDVLPSLSTGAIDSFFGSPLSTLALQWSTHVKYMSSMTMSQATGATVISKAVWEQISPEDRKIVMDESRAMEKQVLAQVRHDNVQALESMKAKYGLVVTTTPPELEKELRKRGEAVAEAEGKNFSAEFQAKVRKLVDDYRAKHPGL